MFRASAIISLLLMGSTMTYWQSEIDRRNRYYLDQQYPNPATRPSYYYSGSHLYYHSPGWFSTGGYGGGYNGGYYDDSYSGGYTHTGSIATRSGVSRGGFGSVGHSFGSHS